MTRASRQDGSYPRPQLLRDTWTSLDGEWEFAHDDADRGLAERWFAGGRPLPSRIRVPFAPETAASGIGETGFHPIVWYRRVFDGGPSAGLRRVLHFGAVDHSARVWVDGAEVGGHVGGQTPFSFDITDALQGEGRHEIVVRAFDDPHDLEVPRGKQDWQEEPHAIWYTRTTGIWQTVWWEDVPAQRIASLHWTSDVAAGTVSVEVEIEGAERDADLELTVELACDDEPLGTVTVGVQRGRAVAVLRPESLRAGQARDRLLWSPDHPVLLDARLLLRRGDEVVDEAASYLGVRSVGVADGVFQLNGLPYFVRAVLEQGFWPHSGLTSPDDEARRREVELIRELGFNTARIHQKVEDPRLLFWADRLGLLIWGETAAAYAYSPRAVELLTTEWMSVVARDRNHPSIVTWVPVNESWGVQDIARVPGQRAYVRALAELTRALDPSRPVVSNDGWEHVGSDLMTIHDYTTDPAALAARYADRTRLLDTCSGVGPAGRVLIVDDAMRERVAAGAVPVMVSEFGGISLAGSGTWGYATVEAPDDYRRLLAGLFDAVGAGSAVAGYCYTQLTDTMQEANGLLTADREPKLPIEVLREIIAG